MSQTVVIISPPHAKRYRRLLTTTGIPPDGWVHILPHTLQRWATMSHQPSSSSTVSAVLQSGDYGLARL